MQQLRPSLAVLDLMLGGKPDGYAWLEAVRDWPWTTRLPVLVCSGYLAPAAPAADRVRALADATVAKPYAQATAANAADFLQKVTAEMPWPIKAIQIDGGSEFMAEFETACRDNHIPLYVLPPRSPKLNGAVERCNGAWRYEFYATVDLPTNIDKIAEHVDAFQYLYNHHRPHGALGGLTPNEYLKICRDRITQPSHMS